MRFHATLHKTTNFHRLTIHRYNIQPGNIVGIYDIEFDN